MIRLFVVVEGLTEEIFVNEVLAPHLWDLGMSPEAKKIGRGQVPGGKVNLDRLADDLRRLTRNQPRDVWFTTMLDFDKFHELKDKAIGTDPWARAEHAETILETELRKRESIRERFIPYVQLHDFEALVLAEPAALLKQYPGQDKAVEKLVRSIQGEEPEAINHDRPPCKRIEEFFPSYPKNKAAKGLLVAEAIGLPSLRVRCPHFGKWLSKLESLTGDQEGAPPALSLKGRKRQP